MYWREYPVSHGLWLFQKTSRSWAYVTTAGSKSTWNDSVWSPRSWYVGFGWAPPVYPTRVRRMPGSAPNWASGVQNQPTAKVAVSSRAGASRSIGGTDIDEPMGTITALSSGRPQPATRARMADAAKIRDMSIY